MFQKVHIIFVYCLKAWIIKYAEWTYLRQMASLSLVSIGLLQFVVYFTILGLNRSCISSKHALDIRKYLKKRSSCDWSSTQRRWYSPKRSLFSLISCIHHRLLFLLLSANRRRSSSSSELDIITKITETKTDRNYFVALTRWPFFTLLDRSSPDRRPPRLPTALCLASPDRRPPQFPSTACPPQQPTFCVAGPWILTLSISTHNSHTTLCIITVNWTF